MGSVQELLDSPACVQALDSSDPQDARPWGAINLKRFNYISDCARGAASGAGGSGAGTSSDGSAGVAGAGSQGSGLIGDGRGVSSDAVVASGGAGVSSGGAGVDSRGAGLSSGGGGIISDAGDSGGGTEVSSNAALNCGAWSAQQRGKAANGSGVPESQLWQVRFQVPPLSSSRSCDLEIWRS